MTSHRNGRPHRARLACSLALSGVLLSASVAPTWAASSSAASDSAGAVVPATAAAGPSQELSTGQRIQGTLYGLDGGALGGDHKVTLYAWPKNEDLAKLKVGSEVPKVAVASAVTDKSGAFSILYPNSSTLGKYKSTAGDVNFTVETADAESAVQYSIGKLIPSKSNGTLSAASPSSASARAATPSDDVIALRPAPGSAASMSGALEPQDAVLAGPVPACTNTKDQDLGSAWVTVGRAGSATGTTVNMTYSNSASSSIGVGVSGSGAKGSYSAGGTSSVSSTASIGMTPLSGSGGRGWQSQFRFSRFHYKCTTPPWTDSYSVKATAFEGGAKYLITSFGTPAASNCVYQSAGSTATIASTTASTLSAGANTAGLIGIDLSAQTGYSSSASLFFQFRNGGRLCGTSGKPVSGGNPGTLVATS